MANHPGDDAEVTPTPARRPAPKPTGVFAVASLGIFIAFVDATIVNIAFPDIREAFPATPISELSWVLNAYNIVFAAFLVAFGRFADLLGRRRIFVFGLGVFTLASLLCAVAPSVAALVGFRVLQALGAAALVPASLGLVLDAYPAERRSHAVALLTAVGAVAAGIGPSLGGLLVEAWDWRLVFAVNIPIGIAAIALARRQLVESRAPGRRRMPDLLGSLYLALAISLLVLAVVQGDEWGWSSPAGLAALGGAAALLVVFVVRCRHHADPVIDPALARVRSFSVSNSMSVLAAAGFYGYTLLNVLFLTAVWGYTALEAGLAITPGPFVAAAVAGPASRLAERIGHRWVVLAGGLVWAAGVLWLITQVGPQPSFVAEWLPGTVILGLGAGITLPNLSAVAVAAAPGQGFATATGINSVARQVGGAVGVALAIAVLGTPTALEALDAFDDAWTLSAACLLVAGLGSIAIGRVATAGAAPDLATAARSVLRMPAPDSVAPKAAPPSRPRLLLEGRDLSPARAETRAGFLAGVPMLAELPQEALQRLAGSCSELTVGPGEALFEAGDSGEAMFVVRAGRIEILSPDDGSVIRELGRGEALGELALLTGEPRSADARAARTTHLLAVGAEAFDECMRTTPQLAIGLSRTLARQLRTHRRTGGSRPTRPTTIAVVPLGSEPLQGIVARHLSDALRRWHSVALLDGSEVPPPSGSDPAASYGPLLDRLEADNDHVVLAAPLDKADAWSRFCLQHADRIICVGGRDAGSVPQSGPAAELEGCGLVAWNVAQGSRALAAWAAALQPEQTFGVHTGPTLEGDFARIARRLTGRSTGIVLSGGGARAFAHIGVLAELDAAGVEIDRVAGVSMGSFVGALYAQGHDTSEIDARCYEGWVRENPIADYTVPRHALIKGKRFFRMVERTFGAAAIEELPRSFFCAASDLRAGELVIMRTGPLAEAVGLSAAMPILGPPQVDGRRILADGSLVDNLPVETMAASAEGPIIAVDVKASFDGGSAATSGNGRVSPEVGDGAATVRSRPFSSPSPPLGETLTRVLLLGSSNTSDAARRHADLVITPKSPGVGLLEFHQIDAAIDAGRRAAAEALERLPAALG